MALIRIRLRRALLGRSLGGFASRTQTSEITGDSDLSRVISDVIARRSGLGDLTVPGTTASRQAGHISHPRSTGEPLRRGFSRNSSASRNLPARLTRRTNRRPNCREMGRNPATLVAVLPVGCDQATSYEITGSPQRFTIHTGGPVDTSVISEKANGYCDQRGKQAVYLGMSETHGLGREEAFFDIRCHRCRRRRDARSGWAFVLPPSGGAVMCSRPPHNAR